jgi:hypothetical protein
LTSESYISITKHGMVVTPDSSEGIVLLHTQSKCVLMFCFFVFLYVNQVIFLLDLIPVLTVHGMMFFVVIEVEIDLN